jgi:hypothetical protein
VAAPFYRNYTAGEILPETLKAQSIRTIAAAAAAAQEVAKASAELATMRIFFPSFHGLGLPLSWSSRMMRIFSFSLDPQSPVSSFHEPIRNSTGPVGPFFPMRFFFVA